MDLGRDSIESQLRAALAEREAQGLLRRLRVSEPFTGHTAPDGTLRFASNDYLGLARHPRLVAAAQEAAGRYGAGSAASRLVCGNLPVHAALDEALAAFKGREAALGFSSGYAAALGTIPALAGREDTVIVDKLSHASLIDGAKLSGARLRVFPHNDLGYLEKLLKTECARARRILIVTEAVFSMDGDTAPLREIVALKEKHEGRAWLLVDEAHATGIFGPGGRGLAAALGVADRIEVEMGTLSKALGSSGGFIAGSRLLIDTLVNHARSAIYSTAPNPASCGAALEALKLVGEAEGETRRKALWTAIARFAAGTGLPAASPIFPIVLGSEEKALAASAKLAEQGIVLPAIRYPTVPKGKARLRASLTAEATAEEIDRLAEALFGERSRG
ncbi:8-amino-7-oxononanoate synthase [Verrucomicrobium sp. GAS474]|uniref:aminotransferase class I/II-fold pyridoxal phosphate-dependent enzyme n=1 Tax=Verrucomicrobium sp. GAS474 TaxID=1882831 RepID=UPI00087A8F34|nr:8-amino-7-oxononanoate synthase [Verrucomicrobium sp. GAS474]SDT98099.1 8-amino-7-oxononanoate synthase [Verrucomicrobium sp. GAS474]